LRDIPLPKGKGPIKPSGVASNSDAQRLGVKIAQDAVKQLRARGYYRSKQWWEYGPQVLTPPDQNMGVFGTHSYVKREPDMILVCSQETPGDYDTLVCPKVGNNFIDLSREKRFKKPISRKRPQAYVTLLQVLMRGQMPWHYAL